MTAVPIRGRYAPSPTGTLHLGNLRTALLAWLFARSTGGQFVLRMEDLDQPRVRPDSAQQQIADLRWLGLDWDEGPDCGGPYGPYSQSARTAIYEAEIARLRALNAVYPCYCTRAELVRVASAPQGDEPPLYPGTCRDLNAADQLRLEASGKRPAVRFRAPNSPISFTDRIAGAIEKRVDLTSGDFIVRRSDGIVAYQLAVVVDDALMGISQVVRGSDLLSSTPRQIALYNALSYQPPSEFAHVPLALDDMGMRMAKRNASAGIAILRTTGYSPERILGALAASCGIWPQGTPASLAELRSTFDPARITSTPTPIAL